GAPALGARPGLAHGGRGPGDARGGRHRRGQGVLGRRRPGPGGGDGGQRRRRGAHDARGVRSRVQHREPRQARRLGDQRDRRRRRPRRRAARRRQHHLGDRAPHGWAHAARRRGGRPRGDRLAAPLRDGEGEVLPAHLGVPRRPRGRADRPREPLRGARRRPAARARRGRPARAGEPALDPLDQARAQQLAAPGGPHLRPVARARDAHVHARRRPRGRPRDPREARPGVSVGALRRRSTMAWTPPPARPGHPYHMHDAIYAQPGALRLVTRGQGEVIEAAAARLKGLDRVLLTGIGTSWHAALVGELLFAHAGRLGHRARALHAFELEGYWPAPDARTGVVVVSHRGGQRASRATLGKAKADGGGSGAVPGKGATALEAALKMCEANHATALGFNCEQFLHGPWAALEAEDVVFLIAPPGPSHERCLAVARVVQAVGAPLVALAHEGDEAIAPLAAETIALPPVNELLSPILAVVPLQLFTYHLALLRRVNPDTMRADQPAHGRARAGLTL